ncbi:hypothetical protein FOZ63_029100, partial [Perkinsus olseni]
MDIEQALTLLESMKQVINAVIDDIPGNDDGHEDGGEVANAVELVRQENINPAIGGELMGHLLVHGESPSKGLQLLGSGDLQSNFACDRVAKWECPKDGCSTCLCRAHGKQYLDQAQTNPQRVYVNPRSGDRNNVHRNIDPFPDVGDDSDGDLDPLQVIIDLQAEDSDSSSDGQPEDLLVDVGLLSDDGA